MHWHEDCPKRCSDKLFLYCLLLLKCCLITDGEYYSRHLKSNRKFITIACMHGCYFWIFLCCLLWHLPLTSIQDFQLNRREKKVCLYHAYAVSKFDWANTITIAIAIKLVSHYIKVNGYIMERLQYQKWLHLSYLVSYKQQIMMELSSDIVCIFKIIYVITI